MINPELNVFLDRWDNEWTSLKEGATPADRRSHFEIVAKNMRLTTPEGVETNAVHWVNSPSGKVRVRVFRHESGGVQPCLIYMHGGAWLQGSPETHWDITSRFAAWNKQTVVSIDYAKAPENPFPAALDQCLAVVRWVHASANGLEIDPERIVIGGDSAGGNLAAAAALELLDGEVKLAGQLLIYPACDFDKSRPSYSENADGPLLMVKGMNTVNAMYCPDPADLKTPRAAPLLADSHAGLPPTFICVAENDPLRDSGVAYAEALQKAGVLMELDRGVGLIHGYLRAMEYCADSMAKLEKMATWIRGINRADT